jgi:charged multivesicular body protein 4
MQSGKTAMTEIRQQTDIEKVDDLMDEIKEEMELADEISNALAQPVDPLIADEDDLLAELNELEANDVEEELLRPTKKAGEPNLAMPDVPTTAMPSIKNATKEEEEELKQLEAELAGL